MIFVGRRWARGDGVVCGWRIGCGQGTGEGSGVGGRVDEGEFGDGDGGLDWVV